MRFLTRHTATPQTGPKVNEVIRAGSSETSSLMKAGIMGIENSTNISTADSADIIAVTAIILRFFFFVFINNTLSKKLQSELSTNSKNPVQTPVRDLIFSFKNTNLLSSGLYRRLRNLTESTFAHGLVDT